MSTQAYVRLCFPPSHQAQGHSPCFQSFHHRRSATVGLCSDAMSVLTSKKFILCAISRICTSTIGRVVFLTSAHAWQCVPAARLETKRFACLRLRDLQHFPWLSPSECRGILISILSECNKKKNHNAFECTERAGPRTSDFEKTCRVLSKGFSGKGTFGAVGLVHPNLGFRILECVRDI
jgi:hypothetical protein